MKRSLLLVLIVSLLLTMLLGCQKAEEVVDEEKEGVEEIVEEVKEEVEEKPGELQYLSVATGGTGGTYYPLGGAIAVILNESDIGVQATAQATGASVENVTLVSDGEAEIAFVQNDVVFYAVNGVETYEGQDKVENIAGIATLYPEVVQIIATKESGISSVSDLAGKRVAVGAPGSGTEVNARQILAEYGLVYDDLAKADYLSFNEATDNMKNKQIDASFITGAIPTSAVAELAQTTEIVVLNVEEDKIKSLAEKYPFYTPVTIPAGSYKGQEADVVSPAVMAMLIVPKDMDEELVYNIVKNMFERRQIIVDTHKRGEDITLETALDGMSIDLHPGAQRYYDEMGIKAN